MRRVGQDPGRTICGGNWAEWPILLAIAARIVLYFCAHVEGGKLGNSQ